MAYNLCGHMAYSLCCHMAYSLYKQKWPIYLVVSLPCMDHAIVLGSGVNPLVAVGGHVQTEPVP